MRVFKYEDPMEDGSVRTTIISEDEIIDTYYDYWCKMMEKVGKAIEISREKCIQDFLVMHWAWKI